MDDFVLNESANDGVTDPQQFELNQFSLNNIPTQDQWNYTIGVNYVHYSESSNQRVIVSRNMLKNISQKYFENVESPENLLLNYSSTEAENKVRFEHTWRKNGYKVLAGFGYEFAKFQAATFRQFIAGGIPTTIDNNSNLDLHKGSIFAQVSKSYLTII